MGFFPRDIDSFEGMIFLDNFEHFGFDFGEVIGSEGSFSMEVVVEAVIDGGSEGDEGFGVEGLDGFCEDMGAVMT